MGKFWGVWGDEEEKKDTKDTSVLHLKKEELDINKGKVKTGDVEISKEIVEEKKVVDVPVNHDEVIIERKAIGNQRTDEEIGEEETIHIPVGKEEVYVDKHTVLTGEVSARKLEVKDTHTVDETLKREEARIHADGEAKIVSDKDLR